jgi:hypothetical protein
MTPFPPLNITSFIKLPSRTTHSLITDRIKVRYLSIYDSDYALIPHSLLVIYPMSWMRSVSTRVWIRGHSSNQNSIRRLRLSVAASEMNSVCQFGGGCFFDGDGGHLVFMMGQIGYKFFSEGVLGIPGVLA